MRNIQQFISVAEFAAKHDVPETRVMRWIRKDQLPHVRLGRKILIPVDALERMLTQQAGGNK